MHSDLAQARAWAIGTPIKITLQESFGLSGLQKPMDGWFWKPKRCTELHGLQRSPRLRDFFNNKQKAQVRGNLRLLRFLKVVRHQDSLSTWHQV